MADTVPAMLEPGEYVLNRNAVKAIGKNKLDELNFDMAPRDLLSRTDKGNYVIPAGKNILGQPTKEMDMDELMDMILPMGMARVIGKGGIKYLMEQHKSSVKKAMSKLEKTGKGGKKIAEDANIDILLKKLYKESPEFWPTKYNIKEPRKLPPIKKELGGIVEDHSLMGYMMPTLDKRLGKPLMKFEHGGTVPAPGQPGYYHYLEERGQAGQTQSPAPGTSPTPTTSTWTESTSPLRTMAGRQGAQNQLAQSSLSTSTSILDIFKDAGFELPEGDYLSGIEVYDPTKQKRLQQDLGMKMPALGGTGGGGFAGPTGAQTAQAEKERDELTQTYQRGAQDYRQKYREDILAQIAEDMQSGTYKFEERKDDPFMG